MARTDDEKAKSTEFAFDLADWHSGVDCDVSIVARDATGGAFIFCSKHHVLADAEAVGLRITYAASKK